MVKVGEKVIIKDNLTEELTKLEFEDGTVEMMKELIGSKYEAYTIWTDKWTGQQYATVDLCVEIPIQCLEVIE